MNDLLEDCFWLEVKNYLKFTQNMQLKTWKLSFLKQISGWVSLTSPSEDLTWRFMPKGRKCTILRLNCRKAKYLAGTESLSHKKAFSTKIQNSNRKIIMTQNVISLLWILIWILNIWIFYHDEYLDSIKNE